MKSLKERLVWQAQPPPSCNSSIHRRLTPSARIRSTVERFSKIWASTFSGRLSMCPAAKDFSSSKDDGEPRRCFFCTTSRLTPLFLGFLRNNTFPPAIFSGKISALASVPDHGVWVLTTRADRAVELSAIDITLVRIWHFGFGYFAMLFTFVVIFYFAFKSLGVCKTKGKGVLRISIIGVICQFIKGAATCRSSENFT